MRIFIRKDTSLGLSFISNIGIFLSHTDHDTLCRLKDHQLGGFLNEATSQDICLVEKWKIQHDKLNSVF